MLNLFNICYSCLNFVLVRYYFSLYELNFCAFWEFWAKFYDFLPTSVVIYGESPWFYNFIYSNPPNYPHLATNKHQQPTVSKS